MWAAGRAPDYCPGLLDRYFLPDFLNHTLELSSDD